MLILEPDAKQILKTHGVRVPRGICVSNYDALSRVSLPFDLGGGVVKLALYGNHRAKNGKILFFKSAAALDIIANDYFKKNKAPIYLEEFITSIHAYYISFSFHPVLKQPVFILDRNGGSGIENRRQASEHAFEPIPLDVGEALPHTIRYQVQSAAPGKHVAESLLDTARKLWHIYQAFDCTLLEINPLVQTNTGEFYGLDCKMAWDNNALFRQAVPPLTQVFGPSQPQSNVVHLPGGRAGCVVNGAGLAMATMDMLADMGYPSANFTDLGGASSTQKISELFREVIQPNRLRCLFINVYGGIVSCLKVAEGLNMSLQTTNAPLLLIRFKGRHAKQAYTYLQENNIRHRRVSNYSMLPAMLSQPDGA